MGALRSRLRRASMAVQLAAALAWTLLVLAVTAPPDCDPLDDEPRRPA